jgi:glycosyltransferase involved in cell wall biosynthesis
LYNDQKVEQVAIPDSVKSIVFILPDMATFSGGLTSVLRLATYLSGYGYDIYYYTLNPTDESVFKHNATINLKGYKGQLIQEQELQQRTFDVAVATLWTSVYFVAKNRHLFSYKAYFIQDFEPYFYPQGDLFQLSLQTYRMGFLMISLGSWNKRMIESNDPNLKVHYIDFPFEQSEYQKGSSKRTPIQEKIARKLLTFAVYLKNDPKRAPALVILQLGYMKQQLEAQGYTIEIIYYGTDASFEIMYGFNAGKLSLEALKSLYLKADFGVVASFTNISLVNYEMIAMGLPVMDYRSGSAADFFTDETMLFLSNETDAIYKAVQQILADPQQSENMVFRAQQHIDGKTWEHTAQQFASILQALPQSANP